MRWVKYCSALFLAVALIGCVRITDGVKCVAGVSTTVLETGRKSAIRKTFNIDYATCDKKVREILKKSGSYIYAEEKARGLIAFYVSTSDTTPVGIFFIQIDAVTTELEVSSPSTAAKEAMARKIFNAVEGKNDEAKTDG